MGTLGYKYILCGYMEPLGDRWFDRLVGRQVPRFGVQGCEGPG